ncbi:unnamed protein product [Trypanosoma congolense IL3000]|uniref:WGS project CAEQ00000000 data, annotated contig 1884 n=1 Tax=Trypanosoma congolense (strain IL3000) TaxID=1068625 RepID=F9W9P8_TRYCI|nr:unnamed protein product [Trypanosoma congolense IL3000]
MIGVVMASLPVPRAGSSYPQPIPSEPKRSPLYTQQECKRCPALPDREAIRVPEDPFPACIQIVSRGASFSWVSRLPEKRKASCRKFGIFSKRLTNQGADSLQRSSVPPLLLSSTVSVWASSSPCSRGPEGERASWIEPTNVGRMMGTAPPRRPFCRTACRSVRDSKWGAPRGQSSCTSDR